MRSFLLLAGLASAAALTLADEPALAAAVEPARAGAGHLPVWALFSFAVSAFREPLR